jgi:triacylglycerol lipase
MLRLNLKYYRNYNIIIFINYMYILSLVTPRLSRLQASFLRYKTYIMSHLLLNFICYLSKLFLLFNIIFSYNVNASKEYVVLLHGMSQKAKSMSLLEDYLTSEGYEVLNIEYPSLKYGIETLAKDFVWTEIKKRRVAKNRKIHFIGYSMGGVVARYIVENIKPRNLGKVIFIASPISGSEIAEFLNHYSISKKIFGPAITDLAKNSKLMSKMCKHVDYEVGVLAGNLSVNFITSLFIFAGESDGTVSLESTKISGMKDYHVMKYPHFFMIRNTRTYEHLSNFLKCSKFNRCDINYQAYNIN